MSVDTDFVFNEVMEEVGNHGYFQKRFNLLFNLILIVCVSMPFYNLVIALSVPEHWCKVPGRESTNFSIEQWKQLTLPKENDTRGRLSYSKCKMFNISYNMEMKNFTGEYEIIGCQNGWEYDDTWYTCTATSQENWVCEKELYLTNTFALARIGDVVGSCIFGQLGDTIGRRPVFFMTLVAIVVGRTLNVFTSENFILFSIANFIGSLTSTTIFQGPLIIGMEISRNEDRALITLLQNMGWTMGICVMPLIMWAVGNWVPFMLITTLPCVLFWFSFRYTIESPRWLAGKGKILQCIEQLTKICEVNKTQLPKDILQKLELIANKKEKVYGLMSLFSHWRIAKNTILVVYCWVITVTVYLTLTLNIGNLSGNPFLNFFWQGLAELPAYILGKYASDAIGRRWTYIGGYILVASGCVPIVLLISDTSYDWLCTTLAILLKFGVSLTFYSINLQALEIFPTCLRQSGMSLASIVSNAVGVVGPYVVYLGTSLDARLPYIIFIVMVLSAVLSGLLLPETLYQTLPDTLADARVFGMDQKMWSIPKKPTRQAEQEKLNINS